MMMLFLFLLSSLIAQVVSNEQQKFSLLFNNSDGDSLLTSSRFARCAVVANGGILKSSNFGAQIDSFDAVFRVNWAPTSAQFVADVGSRVDVVVVDTGLVQLASEIEKSSNAPLVVIHASPTQALLRSEISRYGEFGFAQAFGASMTLETLIADLVTREQRVLGFGAKLCARAPIDGDLCLSSASFFAALLAIMSCRDSVALFGFAGPRSAASDAFYYDLDAPQRVLLTQKFKSVAAQLGVKAEWQASFQEQRVEFQILARIVSGRAPPLLWAWRRAMRQDVDGIHTDPNVTFVARVEKSPTTTAATNVAAVEPLPIPFQLLPALRPLPRSYSTELPEVGGPPVQFKDDRDWRRLVSGFQAMEREFARKFDLDVASVKRLETYMAAIPRDRLIESTRSSTREDKMVMNEYDQPPVGHGTPLRLPVVPVEYASVGDSLPIELTDPRHFKFEFSQNRYENGDQLGAGTYGTAYLCYAFPNNTHESADYMRLYVKEQRPLVIKVLKPGHGADLLPREIQVLRALRGVPYALQLLDIVNVGSLNGLVFPYTNNSYYRDLYPRMTAHDVREWMRKVLMALDGAHSRGIVHMDLKPINIFYDHNSGDLQLGDWGLSMFYRHNMSHSWRTMTVYWKAPEVFLGHRHYSFAVDMWSIGACFAGMIVGRYHFFDGKNGYEIAQSWIEHTGTDEWDAFVHKYRFDLLPTWSRRYTPRRRNPTPWLWYVRDENRHMISADALDLASRMLRLDPAERITAREALRHPYFTEPLVKPTTPHTDPYLAWQQKRKHSKKGPK
jgi:casein kinase II subunit alpha